MNAANIQPYSRAVVKLLKGIVEKDDVVWNDLLDYQSEIQDYISVMGLELIVKKDEGFAFVKQMKLDEDKTLNMVSRRSYGFEVSVILIVLRQILEDFDSNPTESQASDKYVTATEIKEEAELFLPATYNPQIQISAESETKRSIFREKDKTKRSKKESAQHSKSRNKSFVMTSVSAL